MKVTFLFSFLLILSSTAQAVAEQKPLSSQPYVLCKNGSFVRTIRVIEGEGEHKCETVYAKQGRSKVVAWSKYAKGCQTFVDNIQNNLVQANWKCRDISHAVLMRSSVVR